MTEPSPPALHIPATFLCGVAAMLLGLCLPLASWAADAAYTDIAPILASRCVMCHQGPAAPLELRLDSLEALKAGSRNGPVAVPGDPQSSELMRRLKGVSLPRMPMTGPPFLDDGEIALFEQWIAQGLQPGRPGTPVSVATRSPVAEAMAEPAGPVAYPAVAVIFATRCAKCHTENGLMGPAPEGYRLASYADTVSTADRLRVVPGNPAASELMRRIRGISKPRMPFDGPPYLSDSEIEIIEQWIRDGARDASGNPRPDATGGTIRLHGTLDDAGRLDGLAITMTSETRVDGRPQAGDYVQVRGTLDENGNVVVERIRER